MEPSIAITGTFASGKSRILSWFAAQGEQSFNMPDYVKHVWGPTQLKGLKQKFPDLSGDIFDYAFTHRTAHTHLSHLLVEHMNEFLPSLLSRPMIVEMPYLFEAKLSRYFDIVIGVGCTPCIQEERVKARALTQDYIQGRRLYEATTQEMSKYSTIWVHNDHWNDTVQHLIAVYQQLYQRDPQNPFVNIT